MEYIFGGIRLEKIAVLAIISPKNGIAGCAYLPRGLLMLADKAFNLINL